MPRKVLAGVLALLVFLSPAYAALPIPVTLPPGITQILGALGGLLGIGGLAVSDSGTHAATGATATATAGTLAEARKIAKSAQEAYDLAHRMAQRVRFIRQANWSEWLMLAAEDRYGRNAGWIRNANGTQSGGYMGSVYPLPDIDALITQMPSSQSRLRAELMHAAAQLARGVHINALDTIGGIRRNNPSADMIIKDIWASNFSPQEEDHTIAGGLQRVSMASMVNAQTGQDVLKLLAAQTQMQVIQGQEAANAQAYEYDLARSQATDGPASSGAVTGGLYEAARRGLLP